MNPCIACGSEGVMHAAVGIAEVVPVGHNRAALAALRGGGHEGPRALCPGRRSIAAGHVGHVGPHARCVRAEANDIMAITIIEPSDAPRMIPLTLLRLARSFTSVAPPNVSKQIGLKWVAICVSRPVELQLTDIVHCAAVRVLRGALNGVL